MERLHTPGENEHYSYQKPYAKQYASCHHSTRPRLLPYNCYLHATRYRVYFFNINHFTIDIELYHKLA
jgi:hypothetical protein